MSNACRHTLVLLVISALLLAPTLAGAYELTYGGETPVGSEGLYQGIGTLPVSLGGTSDWDYLYVLTPVDPSGPSVWGLQVDYEPVLIYDADGTVNGWSGEWVSNITHTSLPELGGRPGIVWTRDLFMGAGGTFGFQSTFAPAWRLWEADDYDPGSLPDGHDSGPAWSASPEPASMALYGLSLLGVGYWRRRQRA